MEYNNQCLICGQKSTLYHLIYDHNVNAIPWCGEKRQVMLLLPTCGWEHYAQVAESQFNRHRNCMGWPVEAKFIHAMLDERVRPMEVTN